MKHRRLPTPVHELRCVCPRAALLPCRAARGRGLTRGKHGEAQVGGPSLLGVHPAHHLRAVLDCLQARGAGWGRGELGARTQGSGRGVRTTARRRATARCSCHTCSRTVRSRRCALAAAGRPRKGPRCLPGWLRPRVHLLKQPAPPPLPPPGPPTCSEWKVPFLPVNPCTMTLVSLSTNTAGLWGCRGEGRGCR